MLFSQTLLRGVLAHLSLNDGPATSVGGYVSLLVGYTWIYDDWFVLSGGLGGQYLDYKVGSSGLSGFLPAAHTDFIFAILGEELGFLGTTVVVGAFCWLSFLGIQIARGAPDYYGFLLASGLTLMIATTAILNMAIVSGLAPTTGLPLPFFSYGGTNLVTTFWAVGILNNISRKSSEPANG